ncbi:MAG: hypothetical protein QF486_02925 [Candidatus Woesearchaeota archaeon]|jgi:hypothetical protein|nr:hypothetical protein [Candidatus Woesearchaeota archaeon]MDP7181508.1 hypothetical protein [Candidatus Woesearchaeota archaeon]MDP7198550.1 hypothetical protein [Candidatus Woesearchaeota archaeon]MDP7466708.1 hypothetical protein [Candidatus Woesearchaeota archaeon]MDP7647189.1 hypothetical protein [Candidatus Woesearchaeota archaeon]|tara:strand:- start:80 stop:613 length:534 start_codon:yes stop_codon:yes gene_type:complete
MSYAGISEEAVNDACDAYGGHSLLVKNRRYTLSRKAIRNYCAQYEPPEFGASDLEWFVKTLEGATLLVSRAKKKAVPTPVSTKKTDKKEIVPLVKWRNEGVDFQLKGNEIYSLRINHKYSSRADDRTANMTPEQKRVHKNLQRKKKKEGYPRELPVVKTGSWPGSNEGGASLTWNDD